MKKQIMKLTFLLILSILYIGCTKDEFDNNEENQKDMLQKSKELVIDWNDLVPIDTLTETSLKSTNSSNVVFSATPLTYTKGYSCTAQLPDLPTNILPYGVINVWKDGIIIYGSTNFSGISNNSITFDFLNPPLGDYKLEIKFHVTNNPTGVAIYYSNTIKLGVYNNTQVTAATNISSNSNLATRINPDGRRTIWYIKTDGTIAETYQYGSEWRSTSYSNFPAASVSGGLIYNPTNSEFYYVTANNKICRIYVNSSGSNTYEYTSANVVAANSDLSCRILPYGGNRTIWYIKTDGTIAETYQYGSEWRSAGYSNFTKAKSGTSLAFDSYNVEFYYVSASNRIFKIYIKNGVWQNGGVPVYLDYDATNKLSYMNNYLHYTMNNTIYETEIKR
jgi:hypothetical protein